jgi:hypothetical protein
MNGRENLIVGWTSSTGMMKYERGCWHQQAPTANPLAQLSNAWPRDNQLKRIKRQ